MNEEQVKELLERYDDIRELVVRVNANMNQINEVGDLLHKKENDLETKLADLSRKIAAVEKTAGGLMNANAGTETTSNCVSAQPKKTSRTAEPKREELPLKTFLKKQGVEVIDKRSQGGKLWITGDRAAMDKAIKLAKSLYGATGGFASGRATHQRLGWYTDCTK